MPDEVSAAAASSTTETAATATPAAAEQNPAPAADPALAATSATQQVQDQTASAVPAEKAPADPESILDDGEGQKGDESIGAPEGDYDLGELTVGDGMEVDQTTANELGKICKELNLSQKAFTTLFNKASEILDRRSNEQVAEARQAFIKEARADSDIGGSHWNETLTLARRAVQQFADQSTKEYLRATGLDCHPGVIRMFRNVARAISGDTVVKGQPAGARRDAAKAFFYNSRMN